MGCFATVSALGAALTLAAAGDDLVTIGTEAPFPPYLQFTAEGELDGFEHQLMAEVCLRAELTCDWQLVTFGELIPGVMEGRFDVVLGGMAITPERRELVDFTAPYLLDGYTSWFYGSQGAPLPQEAVTAVQSGTMHESYLRANDLNHTAFRTEPEALQALISGQVDLAFGPFENRPDLADQLDGAGLEPLYDAYLPDDGTAMAVCKGNEALLGQLNAALAEMSADGTLELLESRWF
jgi:polar amino acid transport system substrate-binding protein